MIAQILVDLYPYNVDLLNQVELILKEYFQVFSTVNMRIFISHSIKDQKLATLLRTILIKNHEISHVFIFEKERKYGEQIEKKIVNEIIRADYVVAIITKNAISSASVNQELGYAQAKSISVIPLIEKDAKKGFLVYGAEYVTFSKPNFERASKKILNYIIKQGPIIKDEETFTPQELLVQKSAHFRYVLEYENYHMIDSLIVRFQLNEEYYRHIIFNDDPLKNLKGLSELKLFLKENPKKVNEHVLKADFISYRKFGSEFGHYAASFEYLDRYPHSELFPAENDALIKIKNIILSDDEHQFNFEHLAKYFLEEDFPKNSYTWEQILKNTHNDSEKKHLKRNFDFKVKDLLEFSILVITLQEEFEKIKIKYGKLGIKSPEPETAYEEL